MTTLTLYDPPLEGTAIRGSLTGLFDSWRRTKRATGGYYEGKFIIREGGMQQLTDFYNTWIGCKVVESTFGITSWEGLVWQIDLVKNGVNYRRTLNPKFWQNKTETYYTDVAQGLKLVTSTYENTSSSDKFGEMEMSYTIGASGAAGAENLAIRALNAYGWPDSKMVGGLTVSRESSSSARDGLYVTVLGFWTTLNWQMRVQTETDDASTLLATLVGETEFVTAGRLETNALSVTTDCSVPMRIGDLVKNIIGQGDSSGNIWKGGVYADRRLVYEPVPTIIDYRLNNGALYYTPGVKVSPSLINPGFYVRNSNSPALIQNPGVLPGTSNIWNEPGVSYCDEVEYIWPDELVLKFPGENVSVDVVQERVRGQRHLFTQLPPEEGIPAGDTYKRTGPKGRRKTPKGRGR
jgi:hypothetical protein